MFSDKPIVSESFKAVLQHIRESNNFASKTEWKRKVSDAHGAVDHSVEDGLHVARKDGQMVAAFRSNKGMNNVSGTGHIK